MTVKSASGFDINVICASCAHKVFDDDRRGGVYPVKRRCELTGEEVTARQFCDRCEVRPELLEL